MTPRSNRTSLARNRWQESPGPVGGFFALLDPLLGRPPLVVEADDRSVRPREGGDDETSTLFRQILGRIERLAWHPT
jgi:hypothetical protein